MLLKTVRPPITNDQMIQQRDPQNVSRFLQRMGQVAVLRAGLGISGRMVMGYQDTGRMGRNSRGEHFPGMHHGTGQGSFRNLFGFNDPVLRV